MPAGVKLDFTVKKADGTSEVKSQTISNGKSTYELWLDAGHTGTEADYLASLKGPAGDPGAGAGLQDVTVTVVPAGSVTPATGPVNPVSMTTFDRTVTFTGAKLTSFLDNMDLMLVNRGVTAPPFQARVKAAAADGQLSLGELLVALGNGPELTTGTPLDSNALQALQDSLTNSNPGAATALQMLVSLPFHVAFPATVPVITQDEANRIVAENILAA